eukprot:scaffold7596_cov113-Isochrysis_galbana.AAC.1
MAVKTMSHVSSLATLPSICFAMLGVTHLLHALGLCISERQDGGIPMIIDAITLGTCPASVLTPLRLLSSGALLPAGTATALALLPPSDEPESEELRSCLTLGLALHAALSLATRTSSLSTAWPKASPLPRLWIACALQPDAPPRPAEWTARTCPYRPAG